MKEGSELGVTHLVCLAVLGAALTSAAVDIDVGRQLFVDNHLVETTTLTRVWHHPVKHAGNPVMKPETPWEVNAGGNATVRPNGGGLWWDAEEGVFKLWYEGGWLHTVCYATSKDGLNWERPKLDVIDGTNIVLPTNNPAYRPDSWTVVKDPAPRCAAERYKLMLHRPWVKREWYVPDGVCAVSPDGIHWKTLYPVPPSGDRSSMYFDPFRENWVFSIRTNRGDYRRNRSYFATDDFLTAPEWYLENAVDEVWPNQGYTPPLWLEASDRDRVTAPESDFKKCQLYNFDAVAYESVMLGLFEIHQGPENDKCEKAGRPKITDIRFGFSRDGKNFVREDFTPAIAAEGWASDKWDAGYVQPLANGCVIQGDELWFYYGAFRGEPKRRNTKEKKYEWTVDNGMYANGAMGLAKLRRDGFASLEGTGEILTKPLAFSGDCLFINAAAKDGAVAVELVDEKGETVPGFSAADSRLERFDSTKRRVVWKTRRGLDVPRTEGFRRIEYRLRFRLENAALYAFWVSRAETGESNGYLAGGGPGYAGLRDVPPARRESAPSLIRPDAAHAHATRRHEGAPSIAVSPKGRMWVTWYAGPTAGEDENNYLVLTSSTDGGRTFVKRGGATLPQAIRQYDEHTILERQDGTLVMYMRSDNGRHNCLWQAESSDKGFSWTKPRLAPVANLSSRTLVMKLRDGRWLMVKHGGFGKVYADRRNMTALISEDEGRTWWGGLPLDTDRAPACYPDAQQLADGTVVIVSDYNRTKEREISFVRLNPDDILGGSAPLTRRIVSSATSSR